MAAPRDIAAALQRVQAVLQRRPDSGLHDDAPAVARWSGGTRVVTSHANGASVVSDMPGELGGSGDQVTPGWLFRAGLAACATTCITMAAAAEGLELSLLELKASSRSDTRGLLGMTEANGEPIGAGPRDVQLHVRIAAAGVPAERLRRLVQHALRASPIPCALRQETPLGLHIDITEWPVSQHPQAGPARRGTRAEWAAE